MCYDEAQSALASPRAADARLGAAGASRLPPAVKDTHAGTADVRPDLQATGGVDLDRDGAAVVRPQQRARADHRLEVDLLAAQRAVVGAHDRRRVHRLDERGGERL